MSIFVRLRSLAVRLAADRSGATAVITGVTMLVSLGFVGLGADLGVAYAHRRAAQSAADSAAFSAAMGVMSGATSVTNQARSVAKTYGVTNNVDGARVIVNQPATTGPVAGTPTSVEVIVERPMRRFFSGLFGQGDSTIRARAVAVAGRAGDACVLALNRSEIQTVNFVGSTRPNLVDCKLQANSSHGTAMQITGSAQLTALGVNLVGGYSITGNPTLNVTQGVKTSQPSIEDPYADMPIPAAGACNGPGNPGGSVWNIAPSPSGVLTWCGGLQLNSTGQTVNFPPGVVVITGANFVVNGGVTVNATQGTTFVLTRGSGPAYAQAQVNGTASLNIVAPPTGPTAGIAIMQDRAAPASTSVNSINGGSSGSIRGAIYFPKQSVRFNGTNNTSSGTGCTQLIADKVQFSGNAAFEIKCAGVGVRALGGFPTKLVE
ncbi:pilus assembly protein TadG-related protein [Phenylobacterium sp.]|jgi:hypothetical protein|uniref:pilus assembly protein TadG-related protein n=1 Tax=Phenylobacterium sp. TaxID=1871053 RepID=UPI002F9440E8